MTSPRKEVLADGVELWLGDCLEVMPTLGRFDAVVTDPPYGIGLEYTEKTDDTATFVASVVVPIIEACREKASRVSEALKQPDLFIEPPKPIKQEAFL